MNLNNQLDLALDLCRNGRLLDARNLYLRLQKIAPGSAKLLTNWGTVELQLGNLDFGMELLNKSLKIDSNQPVALSNIGASLIEQKQYEEALAFYSRAIAISPSYANAYYNRGKAYAELGDYDSAVQNYEKVISLNPTHLLAHNNLGVTLNKLGQGLEALECFKRAIKLKSDSCEIYSNYGIAFNDMGRYLEALESYDRAISINPNYSEAYLNKGNTLYALKRYSEALENYDRAISINPNYSEAYLNKGNTLYALKRYSEALENYDRAINLNSKNAGAYWSKALLKILLGEYIEGWQLYEWRWKESQLKQYVRKFTEPTWLGEEDIKGKTLLIYPEQGLGDFIQFCRYVPMVEALGANVILEAPKPLVSLIKTLQGNFTIVEAGQALPNFDMVCPVMSLPLAFKTRLETVPANVPYLFADKEKQAEWHQKLGAKTMPRIGIVWSGSKNHKNDNNRSITLNGFLPLFKMPFEFHSLQKELREEDKALLPSLKKLHVHELTDFASTAALIEEMDLVISVDTSVAHLAGALGLPAWVVLPYSPDYRWLLEREDSPWYPTIKLFRQTKLGEWDDVVSVLMQELRVWICR